MTDQAKQIVITLADIQANLYTFAKDVITEHKTGVSKSGSTEAQSNQPASKFNARFHYQGSNLGQVMGHADYQLGVNLRASLRGTGKKPAWIPPANTPVDVFVTNQGKIDVKDLPAEAQVDFMLGHIEDPVMKAKARKALLSVL